MTPDNMKGNFEMTNKMKQIDTQVIYVWFNFGSGAYVSVPIYEGKTIEECLKLRSKDIEAYCIGNKFYDI